MRRTIVSMIRRGREYQAVVLSKKGENLELCGRRHSTASGWDALLADMLEAGGSGAGGGGHLVLGYDSSRVAFYRLEVPTVRREELESLVEFQSEALLPLPREEMEIAWRVDPARDGKIGITIAAARRSQLGHFSDEVRACRPQWVGLSGEALVKAWRSLCEGERDNTVILYIEESNTQICLAMGGKLVREVTSDVGSKDLTGSRGLQERAAERLTQDIRRTLERFGEGLPKEWAVRLLCGKESTIAALTDYLEHAGLRAEAAVLSMDKINNTMGVSPDDLYSSLAPIGLALMELDGEDDYLNLFTHLHAGEKAEQTTSRIPSLKMSVPLLLGMLIFLPWALLQIDTSRLTQLKQRFEEISQQVDVEKLQQEKRIKQEIAKQRADMLVLLETINGCMPKGELLDSISFKMKQPVTITGHTKKKEKILELQENLQKHRDMKNVRVLNRKMDAKTKSVQYSIMFDYKNYTTKTRKF